MIMKIQFVQHSKQLVSPLRRPKS